MATGSKKYSDAAGACEVTISYEYYTNTSGNNVFKVTGVSTYTLQSGWGDDYILNPMIAMYIVPGSTDMPAGTNNNQSLSPVSSWASGISQYGVSGKAVQVHKGNDAEGYLSNSAGVTVTWDDSDYDDMYLSGLSDTATVTVGLCVINDGTTGIRNLLRGSITVSNIKYYTAPSGYDIEVTTAGVRSITVKHDWTNGSVNGSDYKTRSIKVESNSSDDPTYSKTQSPAYRYSYNNNTYTFSDSENMQPNRKYKITGTIDDGTSNTGHSKSKTIYQRTNVGSTTGLTVDCTTTSIKVKASSNNINYQLDGKYVLDYKYTITYKNGTSTGSKQETSGTYAEFTGSAGLTPNFKYKFTVVAINNNPDANQLKSTSSEREYYVWTNPSKPTVTTSSTTNSITLNATSDNNTTNLQYKYTSSGVAKTGNSVSYTGLTPNTEYSFSVVAVNTDTSTSSDNVYNSSKVSAIQSVKALTKLSTPTGTASISSTTNSITVKGTSANGTTNLQYVYKIGSTTKTAAYNESVTFTGLSTNTKYSISITAKNSSTGETSSAKTVEYWTYPSLSSISLSLPSGKEHNQIDATANANVSSGNDNFRFKLQSGGSYSGYSSSNKYSFTSSANGISENGTYTIYAQMKNTVSGFESELVSKTITTWYNPISNLSVVLTNQWYWRLGIKPTFKYNGTISKYEYSITTSSTPSYTTGTSSAYIKGTTTGGDSNNLTYNTNYNCSIKLTDNHGRTAEVKNTVYKTLDERPLYVNGSLKEVKVIKSNGTVVYITPDLLSVVKSNGTVTNMNDVINPNRLSTK